MTNEAWYDNHPAWGNCRPRPRIGRIIYLAIVFVVFVALTALSVGACQEHDDHPETFNAHPSNEVQTQ